MNLRVNEMTIPQEFFIHNELEPRGAFGSKSDYDLLLSLKIDGYVDMSLTDFREQYIDLLKMVNLKQPMKE